MLQKEFGSSLGDKGVNILDPCIGTGNFIVNLIRRSKPRPALQIRERAALQRSDAAALLHRRMNIEHAYYDATGEYEPFRGICFVDTLDMAEAEQSSIHHRRTQAD